jgi:putative heme-binding domain-containing protein
MKLTPFAVLALSLAASAAAQNTATTATPGASPAVPQGTSATAPRGATATTPTAPAATTTIPAKNPLDGNADAVRFGMGLYRARCADCHGMDARGVRAPDLTGVWASGRTDDGLFKTLKGGVPGTEMPAFGPRMFDQEAWQILAYLKTMASPAPTDPPKGNAENGQRIFRAQCASCHRVNNTGGHLGPDLSRVGAARSREMMVRQIRGANEDFKQGYEPVTVTTQNGQAIRGVKKNEDLFSVQVMDTRERIQGYEKDQVKSVVDDTKSAMPVYGPDRLSESDLDDLLRYLQTLRGFDPTVRP